MNSPNNILFKNNKLSDIFNIEKYLSMFNVK